MKTDTIFVNQPQANQNKHNIKDSGQTQAAVPQGWIKNKQLLVNDTLFMHGIIAFFDPANCKEPVPEINVNKGFAVSKNRSVLFTDKLQKSNQVFNLLESISGLRNTHRRNECYARVIVKVKGEVTAGLYIYPRWLGQNDLQTGFKPFNLFHVETCLYGFQLQFHTNLGVKLLPKHSVEFSAGEYVQTVSLLPGENSYETMQAAELDSMARIMANYSVKGSDKKPRARITHHLPWLDYIISNSLLLAQGHMTYQALHSLCKLMLLKKAEREKTIGAIYHSVGLAFRFITPFDNLIDPTQLTADAILQYLGIHAETKSPEKLFIQKYVQLLTENAFNAEQREWWRKIVAAKAASGVPIETLEDLLEIANIVAVAIAASPSPPVNDPKNYNACSLVSTEAKQIQVAYEALFKLGVVPIPPLAMWTSLPMFLFNAPESLGTFYINYIPHAEIISKLIKQDIVKGAAENMAAPLNGQPVKTINNTIFGSQLRNMGNLRSGKFRVPSKGLEVTKKRPPEEENKSKKVSEATAVKQKVTVEKLNKFYTSNAGFSLAKRKIFSSHSLPEVDSNLRDRASKNPHGTSALTLRYKEKPNELKIDLGVIKTLKKFYKQRAGKLGFFRHKEEIFGSNDLDVVKKNLEVRAGENPEGSSAQTLEFLKKIPVMGLK